MQWVAGGGVYYKGTVTQVRQQMPSGGIDLMGRGDYDPWEALEVEWDVGGDAEGMDRLSPWEIEVPCLAFVTACRKTACKPTLCVAVLVVVLSCAGPQQHSTNGNEQREETSRHESCNVDALMSCPGMCFSLNAQTCRCAPVRTQSGQPPAAVGQLVSIVCVQNDPEEERSLVEEHRKAQEAAARTARIQAKAAKAKR